MHKDDKDDKIYINQKKRNKCKVFKSSYHVTMRTTQSFMNWGRGRQRRKVLVNIFALLIKVYTCVYIYMLSHLNKYFTLGSHISQVTIKTKVNLCPTAVQVTRVHRL